MVRSIWMSERTRLDSRRNLLHSDGGGYAARCGVNALVETGQVHRTEITCARYRRQFRVRRHGRLRLPASGYTQSSIDCPTVVGKLLLDMYIVL